MTDDPWSAVDRWLTTLYAPGDPGFPALHASRAAGLPAYEITAPQAKLLYLIAKMIGARRVLEIGTLGGYSTIWLARAIPPDGQVVTLELSRAHAELARTNLARAGLDARVEIRIGNALESLAYVEGPFDLVFIDADKQNNPRYLERALALSKSGTILVADNAIREGTVLDPEDDDPSARGMRRFHELLAADRRVEATAIQTVGEKGWDGFAIARVI
jgi:predicted O-methyltransferase YrrM